MNVENDDVGMMSEVNGGDPQRQRRLLKVLTPPCPILQGEEVHDIRTPVAHCGTVSRRGLGHWARGKKILQKSKTNKSKIKIIPFLCLPQKKCCFSPLKEMFIL